MRVEGLFRIGWAPLESDGDIPGRFPERHIGRSLGGRRGGGGDGAIFSKKQLPNPLESWQLFFY